jgi:hypothetical protein
VLLDKKHQVLSGLILGPLAPSDHDHNRCPVASLLSDLRKISKFNKCKQYLTDMITQVVYQHETRYINALKLHVMLSHHHRCTMASMCRNWFLIML